MTLAPETAIAVYLKIAFLIRGKGPAGPIFVKLF